MVPWKWFQEYEGSGPVRRRGDDYEGLKNTLGHKMVNQLCKLYPNLKYKGTFKKLAKLD